MSVLIKVIRHRNSLIVDTMVILTIKVQEISPLDHQIPGQLIKVVNLFKTMTADTSSTSGQTILSQLLKNSQNTDVGRYILRL